ncbi:MAG: phosphoserine aminotransferase, partial [Bacteroidota bacterium]
MPKKIYFTPGPSQLHYSFEFHLKKAMDESIGSISHRSNTFKKIYQETEAALRALFSLPDDFHVLFLSSAT